MKNILYKHGDVLSVLYYLVIEGGQGHGENKAGKYKFVGTYVNPSELEGRNGTSLEIWCDDQNIKYVHAETIESLIEQLNNFTLK